MEIMNPSVLNVKPEDFVLIPDTGSYVSIHKTQDYTGKVITGLTGYDEIRMVQRLGLYLTSSEEWGRSRAYFQSHPDKDFQGQTGKEIEESYITGKAERVATFLAFKYDNEFPADVHDMLKEAGFDGRIALIDFPHVQEDEDIFISSPRTRIIDVTDKVPLENGHIQSYDYELGIPTAIGSKLDKYYGAHFYIGPEAGTLQLLRGDWFQRYSESGRFGVLARWFPDSPIYGVGSRLSSENKPSFLDTGKKPGPSNKKGSAEHSGNN